MQQRGNQQSTAGDREEDSQLEGPFAIAFIIHGHQCHCGDEHPFGPPKGPITIRWNYCKFCNGIYWTTTPDSKINLEIHWRTRLSEILAHAEKYGYTIDFTLHR